MLTSLGLANVRSYREFTAAPLGKLTLIYGPNSSGKSALVQSLLLLKQTAAAAESEGYSKPSPLIAKGPYVDLGGYRSIVSDHHVSSQLALAVTFDSSFVDLADVPEDVVSKAGGAKTTVFLFGWDATRQYAKQTGFYLESAFLTAKFSRHTFASAERRRAESFLQEYGSMFRLSEDDIESLVAALSTNDVEAQTLRTEMLPDPDKLLFLPQGLFPDFFALDFTSQETGRLARIMHKRYSTVMTVIQKQFTDMIKSVSYLGPMRTKPERIEPLSGLGELNVGSEGQFARELLAQSPLLLKATNEWLRRLNIPYAVSASVHNDVAVGDTIRFFLTDKRSKVKVTAADVGFGISQVLPIIVEAIFKERSIVCIEQPEVHIHPALQTDLADLFIEQSAGEDGNQFLIETHSEHLLLRIQRRIREGKLAPSDVKVLFVSQDEKANSQVRSIGLGPGGELLEPWPTGFFEERFNELFAGV